MLKVEGYVGIVKDAHTGAVLSNDANAFAAFKSKKLKIAAADLRLTALEDKLANMESMLAQILGKL